MSAGFFATNDLSNAMPVPGVSETTKVLDGTAYSLPAANALTTVWLAFLENGHARYKYNADPTGTDGILFYEGQMYQWNPESAAAVRLVANDGESPTLRLVQMMWIDQTALRAAELATDLEEDTLKNMVLWMVRRKGMDATDFFSSATAETKARYVQYLEDAMYEVWEQQWWPQLVSTDERTVVEDGAGDYVPLAAVGKVLLGGIDAVYTADPRIPNGVARRIRFRLTARGISFVDETESFETVWVVFRLRAPKYSLVEYVAETTYAPGDLAYYDATGQCYLCIQPSTGNVPTNAAFWERQLVPRFLSMPARRLAFSEWSADDGGDGSVLDRLHSRAAKDLDRVAEIQTDQQEQRRGYTVRVP